jgi:signal peptidase II
MTSNTTGTPHRHLIAGVACAAVAVADQASKAWILSFLPHEGQLYTVIPGFLALTHRRNPGIAFSFFHNMSYAPGVFSLVAIGAFAFIFWLVQHYRMLPVRVLVALGIVAGGAAGNLIDRAVWPHHVLDFVDCTIGAYHWPAFNVADSAICIGAAMLIVTSFTDPHAFSSSPSQPAS